MTDLDDLPAPRTLTSAALNAGRATVEAVVGGAHLARPRWVVPGLAAAVVVVVLGTTGAALITHRGAERATDTSKVRCYTSDEIGTDSSFKGTDTGPAQSASGAVQAQPAPLDVCAGLWRAGILRSGVAQVQPPPSGGEITGNFPVPPLVACKLDNGVAAVFPGDAQTCDRLQLAPLI